MIKNPVLGNNYSDVLSEEAWERNPKVKVTVDGIPEGLTLYGQYSYEQDGNTYTLFCFRTEDGNSTYACKKYSNATKQWDNGQASLCWYQIFKDCPYGKEAGDSNWKHIGADTYRLNRYGAVVQTYRYTPLDNKPDVELELIGKWVIPEYKWIENGENRCDKATLVFYRHCNNIYKSIKVGEYTRWYKYNAPAEVSKHKLSVGDDLHNQFYLADSYVKTGQLGLIIGPQGIGNDQFLAQLEHCIHNAIPFMGGKVSPADVIHIETLNDGFNQSQISKDIYKHYGKNIHSSIGYLLVSDEFMNGRFDFDDLLDKIRFAKMDDPVLGFVGIDSIDLLQGRDGKIPLKQKMLALRSLAYELNICICITATCNGEEYLDLCEMSEDCGDEAYARIPDFIYGISAMDSDEGTYKVEYDSRNCYSFKAICTKDADDKCFNLESFTDKKEPLQPTSDSGMNTRFIN